MLLDAMPEVWPILGTMTFGAAGQVKPEAVTTMLRSFVGTSCTKSSAGAMIDTARVYQAITPDGDTETTLGQSFDAFPSLLSRCTLATKAAKQVAPHFSLSKVSVLEQCNTSLQKLGVGCIDLFYLHAPDVETDVNDTLEGIAQLHSEGKIKEFGLSNYPAWAVVDIWHRCKARGMVLPTVYQGAYSVIARDMEREIVPVARQFGLRLYMYNPLAGGLLTGRYKTLDDIAQATSGRFSSDFDDAFGRGVKAGTEIYRKRYGNGALFEGVSILLESCGLNGSGAPAEPAVIEDTTSMIDGRRVRVVVSESAAPQKASVSMADIALRWLIHHSMLTNGDGIILGVSKDTQLVANLAAWQGGPLPADQLEACERAWEAARPGCEAYFRGYGKAPGGIEQFLAIQAKLKSAQVRGTDDSAAEPPEKKQKETA